jgi:hypothetical protein
MWAFALVFAALVGGLMAFAGWVIALPVALIGGGLIWYASLTRRKRAVEDVSRLRAEAHRAAPLDKGGIDFTDKDRETLSS